MLKLYLYFYIVILKCFQTPIQNMDNVTLSFVVVVTPRHDKKLAMPISGFMQNTALQIQQRFIEIEYMCQCE